MAKWTAETRRAWKISNPEDWGDPEHDLFPLKDQDDVTSAGHLIGKAKNPGAVKKRVMAFAKRHGFTIPKAWEDDASMSLTADFATLSDDGQTVTRRGKIWQAGEYEDKDYGMTPEENWAAVQAWGGPVDIDLEHMPTILDGKLGKLTQIALSDDGTEIEGTVEIPKWLNDVIGEEPIKVSSTWDRATKELSKLALVKTPRVSDAAVMAAAFAAGIAGPNQTTKPGPARHDTPSGQNFHQMIHDMAAQAGARCDRSNSVRMHSSHELAGIQQIHDTAVEHGATCARVGANTANYSAGGKKMKLWERVKQALGNAGETEIAADQATDGGADAGGTAGGGSAGATMSQAGTGANASADPRVDALQAEVARLRRESVEKDATTYAVGLVHSGRILPSEAAAKAAQFVQAALDDAAHPTQVTFGQNQQGTRLDVLKAADALRPVNKLQSESLQVGNVLFNQMTSPGMDPAADAKAEAEKAKASAEEWAKAANGRKGN